MRSSYCWLVVVVWTLIASLEARARGWDSYIASDPVTSLPLGNKLTLSYGLSLEHTYVGYRNLSDEALSNAELTELAQFRPFSTDGGNTAVMSRFASIRRNVLDGIHVIGLDEPKIADSLFSLYGNNRLSLAFGNVRIDSQLRDDGSREYGDEALNLFEFPCSETPSIQLKFYDPDMVRFVHTLSDEGLRTLRAGYTGPIPTTQTLFAQWSLSNQLREVTVVSKAYDRAIYGANVLNTLINTLQLPPGANGLGARIGDSILHDGSLSSTQKQDAARNLLFRYEGEYKPKADFTLQYRQFYRDGLQYYLAGQLPGPSYNHFLRRTAWYEHTSRPTTGEFRRVTLLAGSGQFNNPSTLMTHNFFRQIAARPDGTKVEYNYTLADLNSIAGAWRWGTQLLIGGDSATSQEGILRGYLDTNNDGVVEENTGREIFRSTVLYGGYALLRNPVSNAKYAFNRVSNKLFELTGSDSSGFPTGFTDRGVLSTSRTDVVYARFSVGADWAIGYSDYKIQVGRDSFTVEARYNSTQTKYEPYRLSLSYAETEVSPALAETPVPNTSYLEGTGTAGGWVNAYRLEGGNMTLIDDAQVDPNGHVAFQLTSPLLGGQTVLLMDVKTGFSSPNYTVPSSVAPKFFTPRLTGYGEIQFQGFGQPNYPYDLQYGSDPASLVTGWTYNLPRTGNVFWDTSIFDSDRTFVAGVVRNPMPTGMADYYRVAPGSSQEYHPRINDRYSTSAAFGLTTASTLNAERFSFASYGSFKYTALTLGASFSINYRITDAGQTSPAVNVVITTDYQALVNPPVVNLGVETVLVPCLVVGGKIYPKYQFNCGNGPSDVCIEPHWHSFGQVFSLETPTVGINDPNPGSCGFGKVSEVPGIIYPLALNLWADFKIAHIPPLARPAASTAKVSAEEVLCRPVGVQ